MIEVKRSDNTSAIVGKPQYVKDAVNQVKNQRQKVKPQKRWFGKYKGSIFNEQSAMVSDNAPPVGMEAKELQKILKNFTEDFLEHAYGELANVCHQELYKKTTRVNENDYIHFFVIVGFATECAVLKME